MSNIIHEVVEIVEKDGILSFLQRATNYIVPLIYFLISHRIVNDLDDAVLIVLRRSNIDSDTVALLTELARREESYPIYLVCTDVAQCNRMNGTILSKIRGLDQEIHVISRNTMEFARALRSSRIVFLKGRNYIERYRWFDRNENRSYVHCDHGIVTKAVGAYTRTKSTISRPSVPDFFPSLFRDIDVDSVESDVEKHSKASAYRLNPNRFATYGYPRFDRIRRLRDGTAEPILPPDVKADLSDDDVFRILFAPTTHDNVEAFPFMSGDKEELWQFLEENDIELYIRMHLYQEEGGFYDEIIDGETVKYAGHHASPASIELLPYFDMLLTDYSSIYMEFLPFDRPIAFIDSYHEQFVQSNGLMFDYDRYFPGKKVSELDEFCSYVLSCRDGDDGFSQERQFVRKVFFPPREQSFLQATYLDGN